MLLTQDNYFSKEAMIEYMSTSQFKAFEQCEAKALAELKDEYITDKDCFLEGKYFEACICGDEELFLLQHPEMVSSKGSTKGELKVNFKKIIGSVKAFKQQQKFNDIISDCEKQVIVSGEIAGLKFKGCIDFFNKSEGTGYDTKCMKDFKKVFSETEKMYISWYFAYGYNYQLAIYRKLVKQQYGFVSEQNLLAVTKEEIPDIAALYFSDEILDNALEIVKEFSPRYDKIKKGLIDPIPCGKCDYCKSKKIVTEFEMISEYE